MKDFWEKNKLTLVIIIILILIGFGILVYYEIRRKGITAGRADVVATVPNPKTDAPYTQEERTKIASFAKGVENNLHWYNSLWRDDNLYADMAIAPDRILIGTANQYKIDNGNDLYSDISNSFSVNPLVVDNTRTIVTRLKTLLNK